MDFYIIDAFADKAFRGNPAGVVIHKNLEEDRMQELASELRFSETAFIKQENENTFNVRYFTTTSEVNLCGHATIAAFAALKDSGLVKEEGTYYINTKAGLLPVHVSDGFTMMEQAKPVESKILDSKESLQFLADILNISVDDFGDENYNLKPQVISTGLFDIMVPVKSNEILNKINPNFDKLIELSKEKNVVGIHTFTLESGEYTAKCRNFAPLFGINEECATGTANGALTYYLYINNVIKELNKTYTFYQGEKMNRGSVISSKIIKDDRIKILVGGTSSIVTKGELYL